jgi:hypothetical protein
VVGVAITMESVQAQPRQGRFDRRQRDRRHGRGIDTENQFHPGLAEQGTAHRAQLFQQRIVDEMGLEQNGDHGIQMGSDDPAASTAGAGGKDNRAAASRPAATALHCRRARQRSPTDGTPCSFPL